MLHAALAGVVGEVLRETLPPLPDAVPRDLAVSFITASFATVTAWWLERHPERPAEEVEILFRRLVEEGLSATPKLSDARVL